MQRSDRALPLWIFAAQLSVCADAAQARRLMGRTRPIRDDLPTRRFIVSNHHFSLQVLPSQDAPDQPSRGRRPAGPSRSASRRAARSLPSKSLHPRL